MYTVWEQEDRYGVLFAGGPSATIPVFFAALAVHAAFLAWLYRAFARRVD